MAAVEVLAKLLGKGSQTDTYTEKVDEWVKSLSVQPSAAILTKANHALERILGKNSELREPWEEGDAQEWQSTITILQRAISA